MKTSAPRVATDLDSYFTREERRIRSELDDFLRIPSVSARSEHNADTARLTREISDRIQRRIGWTQRFTGRDIENFLRDFYTAQRAFLESRKNMGEDRPDKFHRP